MFFSISLPAETKTYFDLFESPHLKIIAEYSFKRKAQHWFKLHVRLQLKIIFGLTKCAWQVRFKHCSLKFSSSYRDRGTGRQWIMHHTLHRHCSTNLSAIHSCIYLQRDSLRAYKGPSKSQEISRLLWVNDTCLLPHIQEKKPRLLEWNSWRRCHKHQWQNFRPLQGVGKLTHQVKWQRFKI